MKVISPFVANFLRFRASATCLALWLLSRRRCFGLRRWSCWFDCWCGRWSGISHVCRIRFDGSKNYFRTDLLTCNQQQYLAITWKLGPQKIYKERWNSFIKLRLMRNWCEPGGASNFVIEYFIFSSFIFLNLIFLHERLHLLSWHNWFASSAPTFCVASHCWARKEAWTR